MAIFVKNFAENLLKNSSKTKANQISTEPTIILLKIIKKMINNLDSIKLAQDLISYPSISGTDAGVIDFLRQKLEKIGFKNDILEFKGDGSYDVINLHGVFNPSNSDNILYFAGHTDVVETGDKALWGNDPFDSKIIDGVLYGRGVVDMKGAIAAFVVAVANFISKNPNPNFGIGFLITGDEEADAINGTQKMLSWMKNNNKAMTACIVGEPTNPSKIGQMIKIGRRGSVNFSLKIIGKQGHVAYPENADNPSTTLVNILKILKDHKLDNGNEFFDPSNLEITNMKVDYLGTNVIPEIAEATFNIRFNDEHSSQSLISWVEYVCNKSAGKYELNNRVSGESFITKPNFLSSIVARAVKNITGLTPELSTTGGTSDARFIKDFCPVVECGLINKTAHQIDENIAAKDIESLTEIYHQILNNYDKK